MLIRHIATERRRGKAKDIDVDSSTETGEVPKRPAKRGRKPKSEPETKKEEDEGISPEIQAAMGYVKSEVVEEDPIVLEDNPLSGFI